MAKTEFLRLSNFAAWGDVVDNLEKYAHLISDGVVCFNTLLSVRRVL